jgi:hypothetical protein
MRTEQHRHGIIRSPWVEYSIHHIPDASRINHDDRQPLMDAMNRIIAVNWRAMEPHWTMASSPFHGHFGVILVYDGSVDDSSARQRETKDGSRHGGAGLVAFSVYQTLQLTAGRGIYRCGTEVLPDHQGRGLYGFFTAEILKNSTLSEAGDRGILYGWRTRNPIVWAANAKICDKVTPSLLDDGQDPVLQTAGVELCAQLYPGKPLELPGMIMRGAYGHIKHRRQTYRGEASLVDAAMSRLIPDSADALFSVGFARR